MSERADERKRLAEALEAALTSAHDVAVDEFRAARTGTEDEAFHNGRVSAYWRAIEEVRRLALLTVPGDDERSAEG